MKLPNPEKAIVPLEKLSAYCLSETHPTGKHKAAVFRSACGISAFHANELKMAIEEAVLLNTAHLTSKDKYGIRYAVDFIFRNFDKEAEIRTLWIVKAKENFPRFVSCYVKK